MKTAALALMMSLVCGASARATENGTVIRLWPGKKISREISASEGRIRKINVPTLTACLPGADKRDGTAVIVCPGGGYRICDFEQHGIRLAERLNAEGISVFVLKYRLRPPSDNVVMDALADGERAVRLVRSRAADFGIDPDRIGMVGYSAGANLILHVASEFDAGDPSKRDPIERVSSRPDFIGLLCPWAGRGGVACPYPLRKDSPPAFICHAKDDTTAPVSVALDVADTLSTLGVPVSLHLFETGGHANFNPGGPAPGGAWPDQFVEWLKTALP
jgi:endo-1,4-beta-xylanase